jgi:hypothetical protein
MSRAIITLRPLTRADLAAITPWFEDADTRRARLARGDARSRRAGGR